MQGEMGDLKSTVAQLNTLANEVTRMSLEVGTEGILGEQAFGAGDLESFFRTDIKTTRCE